MFGALEHAGVDARQRKIVWADGKRLSIEHLDGPHPYRASGRASPPDRNSRAGLAWKLCSRIVLRTPTRGTRPAHRTLARRLRAHVTSRERVAENSALPERSFYIPKSCKLIDLHDLLCDVNYEFNSDNRRLYAPSMMLLQGDM